MTRRSTLSAIFFVGCWALLAGSTSVVEAFNFNSRLSHGAKSTTPDEEDGPPASAQFKAAAYPRQEVSTFPVIDRTADLEDKLKTLDLSISKFQTSVEYITQQLGRRLESIEQKLARLEATTDVQRIAKQQDQSTQLNTKLDVINEKLSTKLSTIDGKIDAKLERSWTKLDMLSHGYDKQFEDLMGRVVKQDSKRDTEYQRSLQKMEVVENLVRSMGKMLMDSFGEGRKMRLQQQSPDSEPDYAIIEGIYTRLDRIINETIVNKAKCEVSNVTSELEERFRTHMTKMTAAINEVREGLINGTLRIDGEHRCLDKSAESFKDELQKLRHDLELILSSSEQQNRDMGEALSVVGRTFEQKLQNLYQNVAQAFKVLQESQSKLSESCSLQADRQHSETSSSVALQQAELLAALRNTSSDITATFEKRLSQLREYVDGVLTQQNGASGGGNGGQSHSATLQMHNLNGGTFEGHFGPGSKSLEYGSRYHNKRL
ncbi:uncharacterized protein LOC111266271 isoform X2 [Varroa jacobsoni]|uniref:Uncharacterized protein n=1 Tax=Varroa destructor TaxID=109461 RepID=A0A7M7K2A5_VARDE|nr:uncharacterized protein LOC111248414 isoform X2 [Varroa destructor]XP_022699360.1 uncharacterized protein LOC111266271 isoform X2 [Varroa jacobsoni]